LVNALVLQQFEPAGFGADAVGALVPLHDQPAALALLFLEPVVPELVVADLGEVSLLIVERLVGRLLDCIRCVTRHRFARLGLGFESVLHGVQVHGHVEAVVLLECFVLMEFVPGHWSGVFAFGLLEDMQNLFFADERVSDVRFIVEVVALDLLQLHQDHFGLLLGFGQVFALVNVFLVRTGLFTVDVQTLVLLLGPGATADTGLGQHSHGKACTASQLFRPVLNFLQAIQLSFNGEHLLLDAFRIHVSVFVNCDPLHVVRQCHVFEGL